MFAVKGWNVNSSALKTQTDAIPNIAKNGEGSAAKKRKRNEKGAPTPQVTDANVGDLWETTIDGKKPKRDRKKQKTDGDAKDDKSEGKDEKAAGDEKKEGAATAKAAPQVEGAPASAATAAAPAESKKKNKKNKKAAQQDKPAAEKSSDNAASTAIAKATPPVPVLPAASKLTPLQAQMRAKLISARFRHLNQTLYTAPSGTSLELFGQNPEMFEDYHSGFRQQVTTWPENPVDTFIRQIRERAVIKGPKSQKQMFRDKKRNKSGGDEGTKADGKNVELPRTHGTAIFADLGCGDARLAQTLTESGDAKKLNLKIMSYDLQSPSPFVTKSDIANLPLADGSVDVAIFCLALMGTNWIDFIEEAYRILHWKGELWIAEIKSRFGRVGGDGGKRGHGKPVEHAVGNKKKLAALKKKEEKEALVRDERDEDEALRTEVDEVPEAKGQETDISGFIEVLKRRGFLLRNGDESVDLGNKMFVRLEFIKAAAPVVGKNFKQDDKAKEDKKGGETWKAKDRKKFIEKGREEKEVTVEDEAKVLKPCLYKIR